MISIIMASYNYETYLGEAIQSVLSQTWTDFELLVVDDGSKDDSVKLAQSFAEQDLRVRVFLHPDGKNHGLPATLTLGIAEARGEWIAFLESDELWEPTCLEQRIALAQETGADVIFNAVHPLPMPGANTGWFNTYVPRIMREHKQLSESGGAYSLQSMLLVENKIPTFSCVMLRAECLRECSLAAPVPRWLDWWIWNQIAQKSLFAFVPDELTSWRLHADSYNHKVVLRRYIQDNNLLWESFRTLRSSYRQAGKTGGSLFLLCPSWGRLLARFGMIAYQSGIVGTLKQIHNRIRQL